VRQRIPQNGTKFGMIANYGEPKGKAASATTCVTKQLEGHPAEPEAKKLWVQSSNSKEATMEEENTSTT
jgi:ribosomal protein L9